VLGERAVVERQYEVARLVADALDRMTMAFGEVPKIARLEVVDLARTRGLEHHGLASAVDDEGPFGRYGVPMQFARCAWIEEHVDARDSFAHGQLMQGRFLGPATGRDFGNATVERILELRHGRDVFWVVVRDLGARRKLHRVSANAAFARISAIASFRSSCGLHQREPTSAKRGCT